MNRHEENEGGGKDFTEKGEGTTAKRHGLVSDTEKIQLMKRMLRLHQEPGVLLLMMVAVLEPEAARQAFLKYANEEEWLVEGLV